MLDIPDFDKVLNDLRHKGNEPLKRGRLFEQLILQYLREDSIYQSRFSSVRAREGQDTGIDLIATEADGSGECAIQCKLYSSDSRISQGALDGFLAASEGYPHRLFIYTGEWGSNAEKRALATSNLKRLSYGDLRESRVDWNALWRGVVSGGGLERSARLPPYELRPDQKEAVAAIIKGFRSSDRGRLIMACGTGKTLVALHAAERLVGEGGSVLYLVPSISLMQQSMREWAEQRSLSHSYIGICSDSGVGKDEDGILDIRELELGVTTNESCISKALSVRKPDAMRVIFCTYQSIDRIVEAQADSAIPGLDLVLCDEAHRTTGVESLMHNKKASHFVRVHDESALRAKRRLFMTATPRIYAESAKKRAGERQAILFSMDDTELYGKEFYRLGFKTAIEKGLLADYRVLMLQVPENSDQGNHILDRILADKELAKITPRGEGKHRKKGEIRIQDEFRLPDAARMTGSLKGLLYPEARIPTGGTEPLDGDRPLRAAISYSGKIVSSQLIEAIFPLFKDHVAEYDQEHSPETSLDLGSIDFEIRHIDGAMSAISRRGHLEWLREAADQPASPSRTKCRVLTNVRCLTEGIDVPALDAVMFMQPRDSHVDIVQAVGRVMRKPKKGQAPKRYGYIIIPIIVKEGETPEQAVRQSDGYQTLWDIINALRSHDEGLDAEINAIAKNKALPEKIIGKTLTKRGKIQDEFALLPEIKEFDPSVIRAFMLERCGSARYWEHWAKDIARITRHHSRRIRHIVASAPDARQQFDEFLGTLRHTINDQITEDDAHEMLVQQIITGPVFDALFSSYAFSQQNPVSRQMQAVVDLLQEQGLDSERQSLQGFYDSVRTRASAITDPKERQSLMIELYQRFFQTAIPRLAERLGIAYTPIEVVDFILHSADALARREFGRPLTAENVHILDPFVGTGSFINRLLDSDNALIADADLDRKFMRELHCNDIMLLPYYIATVSIEEAWHARRQHRDYKAFPGSVLCDTFMLEPGKQWKIPTLDILEQNSERIRRQQDLPVRVIIGNPPYSVGQKSASQDNPKTNYAALDQRITDSYAARSSASLKRNLYDSYARALRWASDRIDGREGGIIALITNNAFINTISASGMRACFKDEFDQIYCLNLRGNLRNFGDRKNEGGNIFGTTQVGTALTFLVKHPNTSQSPDHNAKIFYKNIGNALTQAQKLETLRTAKSIEGFPDWQTITPDQHHDWINQRNPDFAKHLPLGNQEFKQGKPAAPPALFRLYSLGLVTARDPWIYNHDRIALSRNMASTIKFYNEHFTLPKLEPRYELTRIKWSAGLRQRLEGKKPIPSFDSAKIRPVLYRPFCKQHLYWDPSLIERVYRIPDIFPTPASPNLAIGVSGLGSRQPFSVLCTDTAPDLYTIEAAQWFPRWRYEAPSSGASKALDPTQSPLTRQSNISPAALADWRAHYRDDTITEDALFWYVYGLLHSPGYREKYAHNLFRELPRLPKAPDFWAFSKAGERLGHLHTHYETLPPYPLQTRTAELALDGDSDALKNPERWKLTKKMRLRVKESGSNAGGGSGGSAGGGSGGSASLDINDFITLDGIPAEAVNGYRVNGRTPLEWAISQYQPKTDKESGLSNNISAAFPDPMSIKDYLARLVHLSLETTRLIATLPEEFE